MHEGKLPHRLLRAPKDGEEVVGIVGFIGLRVRTCPLYAITIVAIHFFAEEPRKVEDQFDVVLVSLEAFKDALVRGTNWLSSQLGTSRMEPIVESFAKRVGVRIYPITS